MRKPKIYVHRVGEWYNLYMNNENEELLSSFADVISDGPRMTPYTTKELIERMKGVDSILSLNGIGTEEITTSVLKNVESIRLIVISHWWGQFVESAKEAGITLVEGSNANTIAVAEWTLSAALMGIRKIEDFNKILKRGSVWGEPRRNVSLLCESTVGLIGLGRIGRYVARYFKFMGAKVIAYSRYISDMELNEIGIQLTSLEEVLKTADVVSLHLPITNETRNLLQANHFSIIKDGAVFINSARAAIYDEDALINELKKNRFSAYLDVFQVEPLPLDHPFRTMKNVTISPHIAGDNKAMFLRCGREAILTLKNYFEGKEIMDRRYSFP